MSIDPPVARPDSLTKLIAPASVAVVGASDNPSRISGRTVSYLKNAYQGRIHCINPRRSVVQGLPAFPSLADLPEVPDLVTIALAAPEAVRAAHEAADLGCPAAIVFSAGFAETGGEGHRLQAELGELSRSTGMRVLGPNCLGVVNLTIGLMATFFETGADPYQPGGVALVSQSGAFGAAIFKTAQRTGIGVSYYCSTGNEVDVGTSEILAELVDVPDVRILLAFAERISSPELLLSTAARAHELGKPLLFMKVGSTAAGARAAISHTGSIAGSDAVVDAVFRDHGILRPRGMQEMLDWTRVLLSGRRAEGPRLGIVTTSGGVGILLADLASAAGLEVPELQGRELQDFESLVPQFASARNPIDSTAQVINDLEGYGHLLARAASSPSFDQLCVAGLPDAAPQPWLDGLLQAWDATTKPIVAWCPAPAGVARISAHGIPAFTDPGSVVSACAALVRQDRSFVPHEPAIGENPARIAAARRLLAEFAGRPFLLEPDGKRLLALYGVQSPREAVVTELGSALRRAAEIGFPVALKALAWELPHRTEAGAVRLGIRDTAELTATWRDLTRRLPDVDAWLVQEMSGSGLELACGVIRDPEFGPLVSVAVGGVLMEVFAEAQLLCAPVTPARAAGAVDALCGRRLVQSVRGLSHEGAAGVVRVLIALGLLAVELPEVVEIDLNPVIVSGDRLMVADALIVLDGSPLPHG